MGYKSRMTVEAWMWLASTSLLILLSLCLVARLSGGIGTYSEGVRTGMVVKVSRKGVVFKSWECQMNLGGLWRSADGAMSPTVWECSTLDRAVADELIAAMETGRPVEIEYKQWLLSPIQQKTDSTALRVVTPTKMKDGG